jgi:hypothetical protein
LQKKLYDKFSDISLIIFRSTVSSRSLMNCITAYHITFVCVVFILLSLSKEPFGEPCNKNNHDMPGTLRKNLPDKAMAGTEKTTILEDSSLRKCPGFFGEASGKSGCASKSANLLHRLRLDDGGD